jgi:hypothetical protein
MTVTPDATAALVPIDRRSQLWLGDQLQTAPRTTAPAWLG